MRRKPISKEYPVHVVRRGVRGLPFARNDSDRYRNLQMLFYFNDSLSKENWLRDLKKQRAVDFRSPQLTSGLKEKEQRAVDFGSPQIMGGSSLVWPEDWPKQDPLIDLAAFTFNNNHDHMIIWERKEKGLSQFMQKCGISISKHFNEKYGEHGTVLEPYSFKVIDSDIYLQWVVPYVMVKNTFEMHPKGYQWAVNNFEKAWHWAIHFPFSSLGHYALEVVCPIINTEKLKEIMGTPEEFKKLCRDMIMGREKIDEDKISKIIGFSFEDFKGLENP